MKVTIDAKEFPVAGKKTILEVARENQVYIPSLCDHPHLQPFGGCRLCLVEIKGKEGFVPSCAAYAEDGMEVLTKTPRLDEIRRHILELILSEHPNACLICAEKDACDETKASIRKVGEVTGCVLCSNNGRCRLQDVAKALGIGQIPFPSVYRNFDVRKDDPFFDRNYNLCILCGKCVRVCHEVRGAAAVSFVFRGSQTVVGTAFDRRLIDSGCQFCGACVDICPTGALVERAVRPENLPDQTAETVCGLCGVGCALKVELKSGRILCSLPSQESPVNKGQACVRGRFTIREVAYSPKRILKPLIRVDGELREAGWEEALDFVAGGLKKYQGQEIGFVVSPNLTVEDIFVMRRFARQGLKTENLGTSGLPTLVSWRSFGRSNAITPELNFRLNDICQAKVIFVAGGDPALHHPIMWLEMFAALRKGARLVVLDSEKVSFERHVSFLLSVKPGAEAVAFGLLSKILMEVGQLELPSGIDGYEGFRNSLDALDLTQGSRAAGVSVDDLKIAARWLSGVSPAVFLFGPGLAAGSSDGNRNFAALWNLALQAGVKLIPFGQENNQRGVAEILWNNGMLPVAPEELLRSDGQRNLKALYLTGPVPDLGAFRPEFLVVQDSYENEQMKLADVVFPAATFLEGEGSFINLEGRIQKLEKVVEPRGESKPDWWIIARLAQKMGLEGFAYTDVQEIREDLGWAHPRLRQISAKAGENSKHSFIIETPAAQAFIAVDYSSPTAEVGPCVGDNAELMDRYRSLDLCSEVKGLKLLRLAQGVVGPKDTHSGQDTGKK